MARRYHRKDDELESSSMSHSGTSLSGIVKFQPSRRKIDEPWRPLQTIDMNQGTGDDADYVTKNVTSSLEDARLSYAQVESLRPPHVASQITSTVALQQLDSPSDTLVHEVTADPQGDKHSSRILRGGQEDIVEHVFGRLPDPIRLHEQTGEFDGQVIFIGHPNRDVSAHQWSALSFQWVNIGRYAHSRAKVEGSLASDRLKGHDAPQDPLEFFQMAAKNREKRIIKQEQIQAKADISQKSCAEGVRKSALPEDTNQQGQTPADFTYGRQSSEPPILSTTSATPGSIQTTVRRECLEDPFVVSARPVSVGPTPVFPYVSKLVDSKGSLDFGYEFPSKTVNPNVLSIIKGNSAARYSRFAPGKPDHNDAYHGEKARIHTPHIALRDVAFGEEAASRVLTPTTRVFMPSRAPTFVSPEHPRDLRSGVTPIDMMVQTKLQTDLLHSGTELPNMGYTQLTARSLFPPPGLTVANPHRVVSKLNARAPSYGKIHMVPTLSETSELEVTTINAREVALKFSDPDGIKQTKDYEIANGLGQQQPTKQNFKGPFFTDSKPTTSDLTAPLAVRMDEEEQLRKWFHDDVRARRLQDYAHTLINSAVQGNKGQTLVGMGGYQELQSGNTYENTSSFVRLEDSLLRYAEESRGDKRSYFTRAWKTAPVHLRDMSADGNNSFFTKPVAGKPEIKTGQSRMQLRGGHGFLW
ncbi:hypothetical protein ACN47E_000401 [Coniothyrium glycines]